MQFKIPYRRIRVYYCHSCRICASFVISIQSLRGVLNEVKELRSNLICSPSVLARSEATKQSHQFFSVIARSFLFCHCGFSFFRHCEATKLPKQSHLFPFCPCEVFFLFVIASPRPLSMGGAKQSHPFFSVIEPRLLSATKQSHLYSL